MDNEKRISPRRVEFTEKTTAEIMQSNIQHEKQNPGMWREANQSPKPNLRY